MDKGDGISRLGPCPFMQRRVSASLLSGGFAIETWPGKTVEAKPWTLISALRRRQRGTTGEAVDAMFGMGGGATAVCFLLCSCWGSSGLGAVGILAPISLAVWTATPRRRGPGVSRGKDRAEVNLRSRCFLGKVWARCR